MLDIWDEMMALERRLEDLFRAFVGPGGRPALPVTPTRLKRPFLPAMDVFARDGDLVLRVELPGIDPHKDVSVTLEEGEVVVRGERKRFEEVKEEEDYYRAETSYGSFDRRVPVPRGIGETDLKAQYQDGVLEVLVRGAASISPPKAKAIPIKVAGEGEKGTKGKAA